MSHLLSSLSSSLHTASRLVVRSFATMTPGNMSRRQMTIGVVSGVVVAGSVLSYALIKRQARNMQRLSPRDDIVVPRFTQSELTSRLNGKTAVVFGGTKGIGAALAKGLAKHGVRCIIVGRTDSEKVVDAMKSVSPLHHSFLPADLSTIRGSIQCAQKVQQQLQQQQQQLPPAQQQTKPLVDLAIFTTGIMAASNRQVNEEGVELDWAVSALSRQAIIGELSPFLRRQPSSPSVYVMGFPGVPQEFDFEDPFGDKKYDNMKVHMNTVVANEAIVHEGVRLEQLNRANNNNNSNSNSSNAGGGRLRLFGLNPGFIPTNIRANLLGKGWFSRTVERIVGGVGQTMEQYVANTLPVIAHTMWSSGDAKLDTNVLFNTFGEAVHPNAKIKEGEWSKVYNIAQQKIDETKAKHKLS